MLFNMQNAFRWFLWTMGGLQSIFSDDPTSRKRKEQVRRSHNVLNRYFSLFFKSIKAAWLCGAILNHQ